MTRLSKVELRRLFSRRLVLVTMVLGLLLSGLMLVAVWMESAPPSAAEREQAQQLYQQELEYWQDDGEEMVAQCLQDQERERERTGDPSLDFGCEQMEEPQLEWFLQGQPQLQEQLPGQLAGFSNLVVFLTFLVGTTFVAADFATGSMSNWLTFEPRRLRVYASKLVAAGLGVLPLALAMVTVVVAGTWAIMAGFGLADGMTSGHWSDVTWMGLRILALALLAAVAGAALGFLLRHTAAVLGLAIGYVVVVELMFNWVLMRFSPWLVLKNLEGWTSHGTTYFVETCTADSTGLVCQMTDRTIAFSHSAAYILVLTAVVVLLGALLFRRRDVS